ncbi:hypothetical protein [Microcoleus vaginatus]|uniref:hypothetical protein n=1 Tax=Microcoleus vaginatus TaxID=119532 RepID=UPI00403EFB73
MASFLTAALYKFVELPDFAELKAPLLDCCNNNNVKGTILLAQEGINGTIAGPSEGVHAVLAFLRSDPAFCGSRAQGIFLGKSTFLPPENTLEARNSHDGSTGH